MRLQTVAASEKRTGRSAEANLVVASENSARIPGNGCGMGRQFRSQHLASTAMVFASCATLLAQMPPHIAGQNELMPATNISRQLPEEPSPRNGSTLSGYPNLMFPSSLSHSANASLQKEISKNVPVTVLEDTPIHVMTTAPISTNEVRQGDELLFVVSEDVMESNLLIIPRGATIHGTVVQSRSAKGLTGKADLILKLTSLDLEGRTYPLYSYQFKVTGVAKTKQTVTNITGGAAVGGLMGDHLRRNTIGETSSARKINYVAKGAAIGAGAGVAVSAVASGSIVLIPGESQIDFYLAAPISIVPVSADEAERLSRAMRPGGPVLYVPGETP